MSESFVHSDKVIDLSSFRNRRSLLPSRLIFYLTDSGRWMDLLVSFKFLQIKDLRSIDSLRTVSIIHQPDLILVESELTWCQPLALIKELHDTLEVPIVMICGSQKQEDRELIKKAYSVGVYDILSVPLRRDELHETLEVLLKFQTQFSLYQ